MYTYEAIVTKVYDGDTITVDIDLGLGIWKMGEKIRLADIDAPEVRGEEREAGLISRDALREKILNKRIRIKTEKDKKGKYGRYIGTIFIIEADLLMENVEDVNVNEWMVKNGFAEKVLY